MSGWERIKNGMNRTTLKMDDDFSHTKDSVRIHTGKIPILPKKQDECQFFGAESVQYTVIFQV